MILILKITSYCLIISTFILLIFGCSSSNQSENAQGDININNELSENKFIRGKVIEKENKRVFLELIGDSKYISKTIRVSVSDEKILANIEVGQEILVWFDYIRESDPPQTRGLRIQHLRNK